MSADRADGAVTAEEEAESIRRIVDAAPPPGPQTLERVYALLSDEPPAAGNADGARGAA